ncbi:hypothetical protein Hanom_Chr07g00665181 [Helianthus anomalus]
MCMFDYDDTNLSSRYSPPRCARKIQGVTNCLSDLVLTRPVAKVLAVLSQILKIFELTTPRVGLARPRVGCQFCPLLLSFLLHSIHPRTRVMSGGHNPVSSLLFLLFCGLDVN